MKNLPCGRTIEDVLHKLDDAPDLHELECRWCHQERRRLKDQTATVLDQLRGEARSADGADITSTVLAKISKLRPMQRTWEAASRDTGKIVRVPASEIISSIRQQFSRSQTAQLNYTEVKATDTKIPHVQWLVRCTVSMLTEATVQQIEREILEHVQRGLGAKLLIERLRLEITVEDVHGEILGYSEIGT
ncbi:hypothetical protein AA310_00990 [Arthrobacter sp. YC-RL1]|uniref:hypothetical protein n=1 Tax=Arthrobacter sp. YC-RL1 TaxID=1652545 RepID=UPI00063DA474|nr:hypothetical protein [Arthrobacter sp. YC-RL1]ALQ32531.1 hypothetical protein ATC04_17885 [Arthrobacter sp. YC-RL1]KLI90539.1 hypothetical protein AA310_00990 [Arthrobacter sp. YC-RL1]